MEALGTSLALLGAVSVVAALAGALNIAGLAEVPAIGSKTVRVVLFLVGGLFMLMGLGFLTTSGALPADSDGSDGGSATRSGGGGRSEQSVEQDFLNQARQVCQELNERFAEFPSVSDNAPPAQYVALYSSISDVFGEVALQFGAIPSPPRLQDDYGRFVSMLREMSVHAANVAQAVRNGDRQTAQREQGLFRSLLPESSRVAGSLGLSPPCGY